MLKYLQLPFYFDAKKMQAELQHLNSTDWQLHYQKLHYEGNWSALPLRSAGGRADNIIISPVDNPDYADTIFLKNSVYFKEILASFNCPLLAVRLMKLNAGAIIKEHKDAEMCYEKGEIRIHIPVSTNDEVEFYLDKERIHLREGDCWYMNFNLPHSVNNKSKTDRIHLVIDAKVNDWVKELFGQPAICKKTIDPPDDDERTKKLIIAQLRELNTETANRLADEMEFTIK